MSEYPLVGGSHRAVCVTGMHRSGTSLVARTLDLLDVSLGDPDQLMQPGPDNEAGYWENRYLKEFDDDLLAFLGGAWDQPPVLASGWEHDDGLDRHRERAAGLLLSCFGGVDTDLIAWKDPRLSLLLPFWRTVTAISTTITVVRDPAEVAASLEARNDIGRSQATVLWLRYVLAAHAGDPGGLLLRHSDFFGDIEATVTSIADHLGLPSPTQDTLAAVREHLDDDLRHHVAPAGTRTEGPLGQLVAAVWNGGDVDTGALDRAVTSSLAEGWLRSAVDGAQLARARARVVELSERLRRRSREQEQA